jgi:hypothetical protein
MARVLTALAVLVTLIVTGAGAVAREGRPIEVVMQPALSLVTRAPSPGGMLMMRTDTDTLIAAPGGTTMQSRGGQLQLTIPVPAQNQTRGWDTETAIRALGRIARGEDMSTVANSSPEPPAAVPRRPINVACAVDRGPIATITLCAQRELVRADTESRTVRTTVVARAVVIDGYRVKAVESGRRVRTETLPLGHPSTATVSARATVVRACRPRLLCLFDPFE